MGKSKRAAVKSRTAEPMLSPPPSPVCTAERIPVPMQVSPSYASQTDSELPPLPKVRASDQHSITTFFSKATPRVTQPEMKEGSKHESPDKAEKDTKTTSEKKVAPIKKVPTRQSARKRQTNEEGPSITTVESALSIPPVPESTSKPDLGPSAGGRKRKSEVEKLDVSSPQRPTRKPKKTPIPAAKPTPSPPPTEEVQPRIRRKMVARKAKQKEFDTKQFYPFISVLARDTFDNSIRGKQPIRERALDFRSADPFITDIIKSLGWETFCDKPNEGGLMIVKEFYANLVNITNNKVFVRNVWVNLSSEEINKVIAAPNYIEDAYSEMLDKGIPPAELTQKLCTPGEDIIWIKGKNNQCLSFPTSTLRPELVPLLKFICCRLLPTTHTSHVTTERATLLLAILEKRGIDAGWIIYSSIIDSANSTKALWFPAIITKLCLQAGVRLAKGEEKVRAGLQIVSKPPCVYQAHPVGQSKATVSIHEDLHQINVSLKKMTEFITMQKKWNKFMEDAWKETLLSLNKNVVDAGTAGPSTRAKSTPKAPNKTTNRETPTDDEEEETVATHLGGGETLTGKFTMANLSSSEFADSDSD